MVGPNRDLIPDLNVPPMPAQDLFPDGQVRWAHVLEAVRGADDLARVSGQMPFLLRMGAFTTAALPRRISRRGGD